MKGFHLMFTETKLLRTLRNTHATFFFQVVNEQCQKGSKSINDNARQYGYFLNQTQNQ